MCILQCHITATLEVHFSLLMRHFLFFLLVMFTVPSLGYSHLLHLLTGDITLVFSLWTKHDQCCATLPAARSTHWQSRLVMMQCEVTDSKVCAPLMENDRLIFFAMLVFTAHGRGFTGDSYSPFLGSWQCHALSLTTLLCAWKIEACAQIYG